MVDIAGVTNQVSVHFLDEFGSYFKGRDSWCFCFLGEQNFRNMNKFPGVIDSLLVLVVLHPEPPKHWLWLLKKHTKKGTSRFRLMLFGIETTG